VNDAALAEELEFAVTAVEAAGAAALAYFRSALAVDDKTGGGPGYDPVTEADREAERIIRSCIGERFPDDGILGEELDPVASRSGRTWVLDPIDGTRAFMTGMLHWGVLLALHDGERVALGVMGQPYTGEVFVGHRVSELRRDGTVRRLVTRSCAAIDQAILCTTGPEFLDGVESRLFGRLTRQVRMVRYGGDCYMYAMLAAGQIDLVVEAGLAPYDIQAMIPIVQGAGGLVTDWRGGDAAAGGRVLAAGDPTLHAEVVALLREWETEA